MAKKFSEEVKALRKKTGLSQKNFGIAIKLDSGVPGSTIGGWERGAYKPIHQDLIAYLFEYIKKYGWL